MSEEVISGVKRSVSRRRLLKLAEFLEKLPRKRFDYKTWVGEDWEGKQDLSCGTTACALGWAATIPTFRREGLRLERGWAGDSGRVHNTKTGGYSAEAAEAVFGITFDESYYLFIPEALLFDENGIDTEEPRSPSSKATPKQVAKHIRNFVKKYRS